MKQAALILILEGELIMGFRRADGQLGLPGGKKEENEMLLDTATRELFEETGAAAEIDLRVDPFVAPFGTTKVTVFRAKEFAFIGWPSHPDEGSVEWVSPEALCKDGYFGSFNTRMLKHFGVIRGD